MHIGLGSSLRRSFDSKLTDLNQLYDLHDLIYYYPRSGVQVTRKSQWMDKYSFARKQYLQIQKNELQRRLQEENLVHQKSKLIIEDLIQQNKRKNQVQNNFNKISQERRQRYNSYDNSYYTPKKQENLLKHKRAQSNKHYQPYAYSYPLKIRQKQEYLNNKYSKYTPKSSQAKEIMGDNKLVKEIIQKKLNEQSIKLKVKETPDKINIQQQKCQKNLSQLLQEIAVLKQQSKQKDQTIARLQNEISKQVNAQLSTKTKNKIHEKVFQCEIKPGKLNKLSIGNELSISILKSEEIEVRQTKQSFFRTTATDIYNYDIREYELKYMEQSQFESDKSSNFRSTEIKQNQNQILQISSQLQVPIHEQNLTQSIEFHGTQESQVDLNLSSSRSPVTMGKLDKKTSGMDISFDLTLSQSQTPQKNFNNIANNGSLTRKQSDDLTLSQSLNLGKGITAPKTVNRKMSRKQSQFKQDISIIFQQQQNIHQSSKIQLEKPKQTAQNSQYDTQNLNQQNKSRQAVSQKQVKDEEARLVENMELQNKTQSEQGNI